MTRALPSAGALSWMGAFDAHLRAEKVVVREAVKLRRVLRRGYDKGTFVAGDLRKLDAFFVAVDELDAADRLVRRIERANLREADAKKKARLQKKKRAAR